MKKTLIPVIFWALVGIFLLILGEFFVPAIRELFGGSLLFLLPSIVFSFLGATLIFFTIREKIEKKLKKFLLLTGVSSLGFFIFVFLHNIFYALSLITSNIVVLSYLMEFLQVIFFILSIFVCPLGFLIGAVGSILLFIKKKINSTHLK
jgi:hypothetical protein